MTVGYDPIGLGGGSTLFAASSINKDSKNRAEWRTEKMPDINIPGHSNLKQKIR